MTAPVSATLPFKVGGKTLQYRVHPSHDVVSLHLRAHRMWQRSVFMFLLDLLPARGVFVDVGAHIGTFSVAAAAHMGAAGKVIAFEPDPANYALLRENARLNGVAIDARNVAVADRPGTLQLLRDPDNAGGHRLAQAPAEADAIAVPVVALDEALRDQPYVTCLKIDVQGGEPAVLESARRYIAAGGQLHTVLMEFTPHRWAQADPEFRQLRQFVDDHGYGVHAFVDSIGAKVTPPRLSWSTVEALANDILQFNHESKELDLWLAPADYWKRALAIHKSGS